MSKRKAKGMSYKEIENFYGSNTYFFDFTTPCKVKKDPYNSLLAAANLNKSSLTKPKKKSFKQDNFLMKYTFFISRSFSILSC